MDTELPAACADFLARLPECRAGAETLVRACAYFDLPAERVRDAATRLDGHFDLNYQGVRLLAAAYLEEFLRPFTPWDAVPVCEITVPAPLGLVMALQSAAGGRLRLTTGALLSELVLRAFLCDSRPVAGDGNPMRLCGLNRMRERLTVQPPAAPPAFLLQFGVLCDECAKCGEILAGQTRILGAVLPRHGAEGGSPADAAPVFHRIMGDFCAAAGVTPCPKNTAAALGQYARLRRALARIKGLNARRERLPLSGNSLALAQMSELVVVSDWEPVLSALECLADELEDAPPDDGTPRLYAFLVPFLRPEIDSLFRAGGVHLLGSAALLHHGSLSGYKPEDLAASWFCGMDVLQPPAAACAGIAAEIRRAGCAGYLTGMFAFDRRLGAAEPLRRRILWEQHGIPSYRLDEDFWCEAPSAPDLAAQIEIICALVRRTKQ